MPNLTTPIPPRLTKNNKTDIKAIKDWGTALIDELTYIFNNLDAGNVLEAASVKAENIDTTNARITNAQVGNLTADKLRAGQVDTDLVTVTSEDGSLSIDGSSIRISDKSNVRFLAQYDPESDMFDFVLYNADGLPTVYISSTGNAVFSGRIDSSEIYASTIIGTDSVSYAETNGGVFAEVDSSGIKIMRDFGGERLQKLGMSVGDDGTAYVVLGSGDGSDEITINGVKYSNKSFMIEKNVSYTSMGVVGGAARAVYTEDGELWLRGNSVLINGRDILGEIDEIKSSLSSSSSSL